MINYWCGLCSWKFLVLLQSLLTKHDLFESEVKVHQGRVSEIEITGNKLVDQVSIIICPSNFHSVVCGMSYPLFTGKLSKWQHNTKTGRTKCKNSLKLFPAPIDFNYNLSFLEKIIGSWECYRQEKVALECVLWVSSVQLESWSSRLLDQWV